MLYLFLFVCVVKTVRALDIVVGRKALSNYFGIAAQETTS